ncbi:hypothetical protein F0P96_17470 [Hymenobacter busanensis]|uniref:Uncharacterized protein n=1 Tax=Hymenobacter busanensis TaxID=2607656 RepID=A0A7L5A137_9BACT|nr:hypothetical protein [Hymenobacter busanensis]KAA9327033.1 hypothetical protein F0P96_17470 [Hymenobacter busanensis]QHJ09484.1 hypothetical protein GUY19_20285 [Hymenobacter busanensis]
MSSTHPAPADERLTLFHRRHARRQLAKGFMHVAPALVLIGALPNLLSGHEAWTWVAAAECVVGAAYLVLLVRELWHLRRHPHLRERVAWLELAAAGILALEGYHIWHRHHEAELTGAAVRFHALPWVYGAVAVLFVLLAFHMPRLDARRYLHLHDDGISYRLKPFSRSTHLCWIEVAAIEPVGEADLLVHYHDGRHRRIALSAMHDGTALRDNVLAHAARYQATSAQA